VLWTGSFERPLSELAALLEELVVEVAATLEIKVQTLELQRTLKKPADLTAREAMIRAYAFQRLGDPASLMRAIEEAQRSVSIAPDYAIGHAEARPVFAPVTQRGLPLEQVLTFNRCIFANSSAQQEILDSIRESWTDIAGDAQEARSSSM
jgi:hypothetical protein